MALVVDRRRALVLRALGLGDLLTVVPALRAIGAALPDDRLVLATPHALHGLAKLIDAVDEVLDACELEPVPWPGPPPDVAVNLHGRGPQSHLVLRALHPRRLVGFASADADVDGPEWRADEHEGHRWCRLVDEGLGGACDPGALDLAMPAEEPPAYGAVVIHPGAAYPSRRWPPERFAAVASHLTRRGLAVVVTGSLAEQPLAAEVAARAGLPVESVVAGRTNIEELAALVAHARLVVCGDTGMAHLATAYRTPSVVLFGPVSPALWGPPPRPQHVVLWNGTSSGDAWGAEIDRALLAIGVDDVVMACDELVATPELRRQ